MANDLQRCGLYNRPIIEEATDTKIVLPVLSNNANIDTQYLYIVPDAGYTVGVNSGSFQSHRTEFDEFYSITLKNVNKYTEDAEEEDHLENVIKVSIDLIDSYSIKTDTTIIIDLSGRAMPIPSTSNLDTIENPQRLNQHIRFYSAINAHPNCELSIAWEDDVTLLKENNYAGLSNGHSQESSARVYAESYPPGTWLSDRITHEKALTTSEFFVDSSMTNATWPVYANYLSDYISGGSLTLRKTLFTADDKTVLRRDQWKIGNIGLNILGKFGSTLSQNAFRNDNTTSEWIRLKGGYSNCWFGAHYYWVKTEVEQGRIKKIARITAKVNTANSPATSSGWITDDSGNPYSQVYTGKGYFLNHESFWKGPDLHPSYSSSKFQVKFVSKKDIYDVETVWDNSQNWGADATSGTEFIKEFVYDLYYLDEKPLQDNEDIYISNLNENSYSTSFPQNTYNAQGSGSPSLYQWPPSSNSMPLADGDKVTITSGITRSAEPLNYSCAMRLGGISTTQATQDNSPSKKYIRGITTNFLALGSGFSNVIPVEGFDGKRGGKIKITGSPGAEFIMELKDTGEIEVTTTISDSGVGSKLPVNVGQDEYFGGVVTGIPTSTQIIPDSGVYQLTMPEINAYTGSGYIGYQLKITAVNTTVITDTVAILDGEITNVNELNSVSINKFWQFAKVNIYIQGLKDDTWSWTSTDYHAGINPGDNTHYISSLVVGSDNNKANKSGTPGRLIKNSPQIPKDKHRFNFEFRVKKIASGEFSFVIDNVIAIKDKDGNDTTNYTFNSKGEQSLFQPSHPNNFDEVNFSNCRVYIGEGSNDDPVDPDYATITGTIEYVRFGRLSQIYTIDLTKIFKHS